MEKKHRTTAKTTTQAERAYELIKTGILRGDINEGVFLTEGEITKRYGIGRTPYREACNRLHHEGLLEVVPRRGYLVPEMSFQAMRDLFEMRLILEGNIAELAATRATRAEIDDLDRLALRPIPAKAVGNGFEEVIQANTEFHLQLAAMSQNRELAKTVGWILERMRRPMYLELRSSPFQPLRPLLLHRPVVTAIRRRNPTAAREAVIRHITQAQQAVFGKRA